MTKSFRILFVSAVALINFSLLLSHTDAIVQTYSPFQISVSCPSTNSRYCTNKVFNPNEFDFEFFEGAVP